MAEYMKPWLSVEAQIARLADRGVEIPDAASCEQILRAVGYYRLTGYLYPFRESERYIDGEGSSKIRVLNRYRVGTSIKAAADLIDFDRRLRMLVLDGIERIEVSLRMQIGYALGRSSPFSHLVPETFVGAFTEPQASITGELLPSKHDTWIERLRERQSGSDEAFVTHFRDNYGGQMPIWALTEIMELGQLSRLYTGLNRALSSEIAAAYNVPSKKIMASWIASLNYVRNVSAHHARLYNRKLVTAPRRAPRGQVPLLDHLKDETSSKEIFGLYNVLAIMAFLLRSIEPDGSWANNAAALIKSFPNTETVTISSLGVPGPWADLDLWCP